MLKCQLFISRKYINNINLSRSLFNNSIEKRGELKNFILSPKDQNNLDDYHKPLKSLEQALDHHINLFGKKKELKSFITKDEETIRIVEEIVNKQDEEEKRNFYKNVILKRPDDNANQLGSLSVKISDINDYPNLRERYENEKRANKNTMLCIGGPACEEQVVMASVIEPIKSKLDKIIYMTRDYAESNVNYSAMQSHARHGTALNFDPALTGHAVLFEFFRRLLFGDKIENVFYTDYKKVDLKFDFWNISKWKIYMLNEVNWALQETKRLLNRLSEHDLNKLDSARSQDVMHIIEKECDYQVSSNSKDVLDNTVDTKCTSYFVVFTEPNEKNCLYENEELDKVNIKWERWNADEAKKLFKRSTSILSIHGYYRDTHMLFDIYLRNKLEAVKRGAQWIEGDLITNIIVKKSENSEDAVDVCGVLTKDGQYVYANKLHFSGGYKVNYTFESASKTRFKNKSAMRNYLNKFYDAFNLQQPLNNKLTIATGVSINAVFYRSKYIDELIDKLGSIGEIGMKLQI
jgi:hypothetical protein